MNTGRYTFRRVSEKACEGERFGADGLPVQCEDTPVFELIHSNGRSLNVCEYHIEFYRNALTSFREAVRDIWPAGKIGTR